MFWIVPWHFDILFFWCWYKSCLYMYKKYAVVKRHSLFNILKQLTLHTAWCTYWLSSIIKKKKILTGYSLKLINVLILNKHHTVN